MAEKAGFEGEGEVEFRSPGKIRDARDEGFQETCRTCQDSNKIPKRHARDNEICVRPANERKKDPENREETPTSNRPASTGRRNMQDESRKFPGAHKSFRGQAAENPRLSS